MEHLVHASLQFVPLGDKEIAYAKIDKVIELFTSQELLRSVSPLESLLEGTLAQILEALKKASELCLAENGDELVLNIRIHAAFGKDVSWAEKVKNR
jgi:uncharacterized protein YqgV (UPF0045/DUF77 family)